MTYQSREREREYLDVLVTIGSSIPIMPFCIYTRTSKYSLSLYLYSGMSFKYDLCFYTETDGCDLDYQVCQGVML